MTSQQTSPETPSAQAQPVSSTKKVRRIIFLDLDGVLNSERTYLAFGGWPTTLDPPDIAKFDPVAIKLVSRLRVLVDAEVILSSSWRISYNYESVGKALGVPMVGATPSNNGAELKERGHYIQEWLDQEQAKDPETELIYIIVDDLPTDEFLASQLHRLVSVDGQVGLSLRNYQLACHLFGISSYTTTDGEPW